MFSICSIAEVFCTVSKWIFDRLAVAGWEEPVTAIVTAELATEFPESCVSVYFS